MYIKCILIVMKYFLKEIYKEDGNAFENLLHICNSEKYCHWLLKKISGCYIAVHQLRRCEFQLRFWMECIIL